MKNIVHGLTRQYEHWTLGAMLLLLHLAVWGELGSLLSRSLVLAHLGLFLIWQPLWRRDQRLDLRSAAVFLLFTVGFVAWLNWWLMFSWLILLIGLVGGRVLLHRNERYTYLLTLVFLVSELLIACVTQLFQVPSLPRNVTELFQFGLVFLPLAVTLIPAPPRSDRPVLPSVDFFRGIAIALMTAMLALSSLLIMYHTGVEYTAALLQSLLVLAALLFGLSWLFSPHGGFSGLAQLWESSLLNIGTPFEEWLRRLARLAQHSRDPGEFLEAGMISLADLPWVTGLRWSAGDLQGSCGERSFHVIPLRTGDLEVSLYTGRPVGATLRLHCKLLVQLLSDFHTAKRREQLLAQQAHMQAIHETGARVTHDIKNLLQSLHTMTLALEMDRRSGQGEGQELFQRQLPHLTRRLQLALDKLQAPGGAPTEERLLQDWWELLKARYAGESIRFIGEPAFNPPVPAEFLDSVVENLLENARNKRQLEPDIDIQVVLHADEELLSLRVADSGSPVPEDKAKLLFREPLASSTGLGVGLFQLARHAEALGFRLRLADNRPGSVAFELLRGDPGANGHSQYRLFETESED